MQGQILYSCHKNKIRTNEPNIWKNNKHTQPKLSRSCKKNLFSLSSDIMRPHV